MVIKAPPRPLANANISALNGVDSYTLPLMAFPRPSTLGLTTSRIPKKLNIRRSTIFLFGYSLSKHGPSRTTKKALVLFKTVNCCGGTNFIAMMNRQKIGAKKVVKIQF